MTVITDGNGKIKRIEKLPDSFIEAAVNAGIMKSENAPPMTTGITGTANSGFCYADHVHPYSSEWMNDEDFIVLKKSIEQSAAIVERAMGKEKINAAKVLLEAGSYIIRLYLLMMTEFAKLMPTFLKILILILEGMSTWDDIWHDEKVIKDEEGNEYNIDEMISDLKKQQ